MAVYYISSSNPVGTLTGSTPSVPATDWVAGNCHAALTQTATNALVDGDEVIYNDGTHPHVAQISIGGALGAGAKTLTFKTRYGTAGTAIIDSTNLTSAIFAVNPGAASGKEHACIFEDLTFTITGISTAAGPCVFVASNDAVDQTFNRCVFRDITATNNGTASGQGHLFVGSTVPVGIGSRTITFTDCTFSGITTSSLQRPSITGTTIANNAITFNDCIITNHSHTYAPGVKAGGIEGYISNSLATETLTINGLTVTDSSINGDDVNGLKGIIVSTSTGGTTNINNFHSSNINVTGSLVGIQAVGFTTSNGADTNSLVNSSAKDCTNRNNGNATGCLVTSVNTSTIVRMEDCEASNNVGFYGAVADGTAGGQIIAVGCKGYNNDGWIDSGGWTGETIYGVDFYSGGTGDMSLTGCETRGAIVAAGSICSSVFGMNNTSTGGPRDKTITMQNCTFGAIGSAPLASTPTVYFFNSNPDTNSLTITMTGCIVWGGTTVDIDLKDDSTDPLALTCTSCSYETTPDGTGANVTFTEDTPISGDPLLSATNQLQIGSSCIGVGTKWWTGANPLSANSEPYTDFDLDIGGNQSTLSPYHPDNL